MNRDVYNAYLDIMKNELIVAMGCTEPTAIAYIGAKAREAFGQMPDSCIVRCSGGIIKNAKGATVPNSGGMKGIDVAAVLGIVGGDASRKLAVLETVTDKHIEQAKALLQTDFCRCGLIEDTGDINIIMRVERGEEYLEIEIQDSHTNITRMEKNGEVIFSVEDSDAGSSCAPDKSLLNVRDILRFADTVEFADIEEVITRQIKCNTAISREGLSAGYGAEVGRTLINEFGAGCVRVRAKAAAAAGSDARMSGCPLPVVINSGSGNQGLTVTMPVVEYAKELNASDEKLYRALVVSNLIAIHQKKYIGKLSAYCGAVCAACGSGAAVCYLMDGGYDEICDTITNTIANIGGMVCDGAKPSCAAKIASAVEAALMGLHLSRNKKTFRPGDGLVKRNVEETIASVGRMGREGMRSTDVEILRIMMEN